MAARPSGAKLPARLKLPQESELVEQGGAPAPVAADWLEMAVLGADGSVRGPADSFLATAPRDHRFGLAGADTGTGFDLVPIAAGATIVTIASGAEAQRLASGLAQVPPGGVLVCRLNPAAIRRGIAELGRAFGMQPAALRTLEALFLTCDVRKAAAMAGVTYETARENLEAARHAVGAANLPRLLSIAVVGSIGTPARGHETDRHFGEVFGLSERQTRLAGLMANGSTRIEAAVQLGLSEALVKKELSAIFAATEVENALGLSRLMAELRLLSIVTGSEDRIDPWPPPASRTIRLNDPAGRSIAIGDYGPRHGQPVLVLHSSMTDRPVNRALVEALQNEGYRPVAIDRPGFGDTDPAPAGSSSYFDRAATDMATVCEAMEWSNVAIVTRGAAQVVLALHRLHPGLIARAVIVNPDPDGPSSTRADTFMARIKRNFARRPWAVEAMTRVLVALSSYERVRDNMLRLTADCPADAAVMRDPANLTDYYRGVIGFRRGRTAGFVAEQVALATMGKPDPVPGTGHFVLLVGEHDFLHDPAQTRAYWRDVLPDAEIVTIAGAGRFLTYSHAGAVLAALAR